MNKKFSTFCKFAPVVGLVVLLSGCLTPVDDGVADVDTPVVVGGVNNKPTITGSAPTEAPPGSAYSFSPTASDADGDTLTFEILHMPSWASFDSQYGTLSGMPTMNDVGTYRDIVISVSDGTDSTSLQAFAISVESDGGGGGGGGGYIPPENPSAYRGIPDPSSALGFDVWGTYPASQTVTGSNGQTTLSCDGTATNPCLIDASGASFSKLTLTGSYVVLQGGLVNPTGTGGGWFRSSGCTNCVIRDVEISGPRLDSGHNSVVGIGSFNVWLRGSVHGFGDNRVDAREQDFHGFKIQTTDVWILEAEIYDVSGDSIQVGDATRGSGARVYIGGGYYHHNRENAVDIKDSNDVVVSGVMMEGFRPTSSSPGEALIIHDDAFDARVYDCIISDSTLGIVSSGKSGHIIQDNTIQALRVGIQLRNTSNLTVTGNVIDAPVDIEVQGGVSGTIQGQ